MHVAFKCHSEKGEVAIFHRLLAGLRKKAFESSNATWNLITYEPLRRDAGANNNLFDCIVLRQAER